MEPHALSNALKHAENNEKLAALQFNTPLIQKKKRLLDLSNQQATLYQKMAKVFLKESPDIREMGEIRALLDDLKTHYSGLSDRSNVLSQAIIENSERNEQLTIKAQELGAQATIRLNEDAVYVARLSEVEAAKEHTEAAKTLNERIRAEYHDKFPAYEADARYAYLLKRHFNEPQYRGWGIIRNIDHWLARQVNFIQNRKNQQMLISLLMESTQRFKTARATHDHLVATQAKIIHKVETDLGLTAVYSDLEKLSAILLDYQTQNDALMREIKGSKEGTGSFFLVITKKLAEVMAQLPTLELMQLTLKTYSTEDDQYLNEVNALNEGIRLLEDDIQRSVVESERYATRSQRLAETTQLFHALSLDTQGSSYRLSLIELERLIQQVIDDQISPQKFIATILNVRSLNATTKSFNSDWSSSSGPSWSSSQSSASRESSNRSSSSGGFKTTDRTSGGGGFKTTDRF